MKESGRFWNKVELCKHKNLSPNYFGGAACGTPYCIIHETHCLDCGVYISNCGCRVNSGLDGWSWSRRSKFEAKKRKVYDLRKINKENTLSS